MNEYMNIYHCGTTTKVTEVFVHTKTGIEEFFIKQAIIVWKKYSIYRRLTVIAWL